MTSAPSAVASCGEPSVEPVVDDDHLTGETPSLDRPLRLANAGGDRLGLVQAWDDDRDVERRLIELRCRGCGAGHPIAD
jgi:hypothetical protein